MRRLSDAELRDAPTLGHILRNRAQYQFDRLACTFLEDGERVVNSLTYGTLDLAARAIGARLYDVGPVNSALLLYPSGLDFISAFVACLQTGIVAITAPQPSPGNMKRVLPRLRAVIADARPSLILTTSVMAAQFRAAIDAVDGFEGIPWLLTDTIEGSAVDASVEWAKLDRDPGALAYIQYTSGSTGAPRGVMVSHANLLHNLACLDQGWSHTPKSVVVSWLPVFHDMGLVYGVCQGLFSGCPSVLMSPFAFIRRPIRWLRAIAEHGGTHSAAPNFGYDLCVRKTTPEERAGLDLRRWIMALNGAETVRHETLRRFAATFQEHGFRWQSFCPGYGLAEATLKVTSTGLAEPPALCTVEASALEHGYVATVDEHQDSARILVGSGRPALDTTVAIVHSGLAVRCAAVEVGEIWVSGPSIARGYWQRPNESQRTFNAYLADSGEGPFLRTGDLGFLHDEVLFVTGRQKDLIIIRGRNLYPDDIEQTVQAIHHSLRSGCGAAFSIDVDDEERVVVVQEIERKKRPGNLVSIMQAIRRAVSLEHDVMLSRIVLVAPGGLPKTSSGKLERRATRTAYLADALPIVAELSCERDIVDTPDEATSPRRVAVAGTIEHALSAIVAGVLGIAHVGVSDDFFDLGGDSLRAAQVLSRIRDEFNVELPQYILFAAPTIAALASMIAGSRQLADAGAIAATESIDSPAAHRLLRQLDELSADRLDALLEILLPEAGRGV